MTPLKITNLYREIHEQPAVIQKLISEPQDAITDLANEILKRKIHHIVIAARGTSDNAGRYAQYILGANNKIVVSLTTPSLYTIYRQPPNLKDTLVIGISQSGKSPDIVSILKEGQKQGVLTAAITNYSDSDLGQAADIVLNLQASEELSLAATKTYTAQLTSLALLSHTLNPSAQSEQDLFQLPARASEVFSIEPSLEKLAERYRYMPHCVVIGRGFNFATACELSLKMKELTYTIAEPYSSADFLHGPVALVDQGFPVFAIAPHGMMDSEMEALVEKVQARYAEVIILSDRDAILGMSQQQIILPTDVPEWLSPITTIIPGQMFAMYLAHARKIDVDTPRGLNKVTETW